MRSLLKKPMVNAVCISLFSAFYALVFMTHTGTDFERSPYYEGDSLFWVAWSDFLYAEKHISIAKVLIAVTLLIVALLIIRSRPYDEYHTAILINCLVAATILTLTAIAVFYWIILSEPIWIAGKFTLFIIVHWTTVVFANLVYVLLCRQR